MSLSDVMQHAALSLWAELALVLFLSVFVVVSVRVFRSDRAYTDEMSSLPLEHDDVFDTTADEVSPGRSPQ